MGMIFLILVAWCLFSVVFAELMPIVLEFLWYSLCYLAESFSVAMDYLVGGLLRLIVWAARKCGRGLVAVCVFLAFLIQECWRGPAYEDDSKDSADDVQDRTEEPDPADPYQAAIDLLGLSPGFSRAALNRAYKQAMKQAHPDAGGSTRQAQAVNTARDLLKHAHGWS